MARTKRRRPGAVVYTVFLVLWILALSAAAFFVLTQIWDYAEKYEAARPDDTMDAYIERLSVNLWDDTIADTIAAMPHEVQSDAECKELVKEMLSNELGYARQSGGDAETIKYDLLCGGNVFGTVTLGHEQSAEEASGENGFFGDLLSDTRPWIVKEEEFDFTGLYSSVEIVVPETYSVQLNGVTLGEEYIIERDIPYDVFEDYYAQYPDLPKKVHYRFDNVFGHLEPVVLNEDGEETAIDETRDDSQFIKPVDEAITARMQDFANAFADVYLAFSSTVYDPVYAYSNLAPYILLGGDLDNRLHLAIEDQAGSSNWLHTGSYRFEYANLENTTDLGDGYYVLEITAKTTTTFPNHGENGVVVDHNGLRVIVHDTAGEIRAVAVERYEVS